MSVGKEIPKEKTIDDTLTLLNEGYEYILKRCEQYNTDLFQTRLLGQTVICMSGEEAARAFYDEKRFERGSAVPKRIQKSLFGEGAVQSMDGEEHKQRKGMFMSVMTHDQLERLNNIAKRHWLDALPKWEKKKRIVLLEEAKVILLRIACEWVHVPVKEKELRARADDMADMVEAFGGVGARYQQGKAARKRTEKWVTAFVERVRAGKESLPSDSIAATIIRHEDLNGEQLDSRMAAIELINLLRPIVAISIYIVYGALALYEHPSVF